MRQISIAAILAALSFAFPVSIRSQTCTWSASAGIPPSSTSLRSYKESFHSPARLAVDGSGYVYVTDPRVGEVVVRDPYGRLASTVEGLNIPMGIAVNKDGRIYVGEQGNGRVTVFDKNWNPLYFLGAGAGEFLLPNDIAIDSDSGWIYVSDSDAHVIKVYAPADGAFLFSFGGKGPGPGQFDFPAGVYVRPVGVGPAVEVFVADQNNDRIQVLDRNGNFLRCIGGGSFSFSRKFGRIQGLTGDSLGRLYVADAFQGYVQVLDASGYRLSTIGTFGEGPGQLRTPMDVAIDPHNRLIVSSANNSRVEQFGLDSFTDPLIISAVVNIRPDRIRRSTRRDFISAYIEIPDYRLDQVIPASITANGVPALPSSAVIGDYDRDGIPDLRVNFDAAALLATVPDGDVTILVSGKLISADAFEGSDTLRVRSER